MKHISYQVPKILAASQAVQSPIETILFKAFYSDPRVTLCRVDDNPTGEGVFMFPQMPVGHYRADFIFQYCGYPPASRVWPPRMRSVLCVECDGREYHTSPEQLAYDKKRDEFFLENGIETKRYSGSEITKNSDFIVEQVMHELQMKSEVYDD